MSETKSQTSAGKEFEISRVLDAPRERVWQALTDGERMKDWWGPTGFTVFAAKMDLRPGGIFHCGMRSFEGFKMWGKYTYHEVVAPERLVFVHTFSNEAGSVARHPIVPTWPMETLTKITFEEEPGDKTKMTVHWSAHNPTEVERKTFDTSHAALKMTWNGTFDQLAAYLAKA